MNEKVSVIIPVYNAEKTIIRCLDSISKQTYPELEVIIINDGSSDKSESIITDYIRKKDIDKQFIFFSQVNQGVAASRNTGINHANGKYIAFADSDDYMSPDAIEHMVRIIRKTNAVMVIANHIRHEKNKNITFKTDLPANLTTDIAIKALFEKKIRVGCCGKLYTIDWLKEHSLYFPEDRYGEDIYHLFYTIMSGGRIVWLNEVVYHVVDTESSICNSYSTKFIKMLDTMDEIKVSLLKTGFWNKHKKEFKKYYLSHIKYLLNYGIRFQKNDFLSAVLGRNMYPYGQIQIEWSKGIKSVADGILFNLNKKLYVAIKIKRRIGR